MPGMRGICNCVVDRLLFLLQNQGTQRKSSVSPTRYAGKEKKIYAANAEDKGYK